MTNEVATVSDIERMAIAVADSKLFGIKTKQEAMSLMYIAQAEGLHPAIAARDYHVVHGRPTLKADAMMSRFQAAGGSVDWHVNTDERAEATFSHPQGGSVKIDWDMNRAKQAELLSNAMWKKYPRQMLRARVISEGIRTVFPGVSVGMYTPEEVNDMEAQKPAKRERVTPPKDAIDVESTPVKKPLPQAVADDEVPEFAAKLPDGDPVLEKAREEAMKGTKAFKAWWAENPSVRKELKPHVPELKEVSEMVDKNNEKEAA